MGYTYSLQQKIDRLRKKQHPISLGSIQFCSPFLLAPMSGITSPPFRILMEELGAGGVVSELISCHGINHGNKKTLNMLQIDPKETTTGLQLFGEDAQAMAKAALKACESMPRFIDINMGCPVRKVVSKGAGSALLDYPSKLGNFFSTIKKAISVPLTIKIRTGPCYHSRNAHEILHIAKEEGIEFVAVHGRTRTQQYKGYADWDYMESLAEKSLLPLIGNGDIFSSEILRRIWKTSSCSALMIGRGALRNPFIFLEGLDESTIFHPGEYWEVVDRFHQLLTTYFQKRLVLILLRKHIIWFASGLPKASLFRQRLFEASSTKDVMKMAEDYFLSLDDCSKKPDESFMRGGHG